MMKWTRLSAALIILLFINSFSMAATFQIYPKQGTTLPTEVIEGSFVYAYYTVQNNTNRILADNYIRSLPKNVELVTQSPTYPESCHQVFTLPPKGSCTLQLKIIGTVNETDPDSRNHLIICPKIQHGCTGTHFLLSVSVIPKPIPTLNSITITPSTTNALILNQLVTFTATGTYSDQSQQDISAQVTWNSNNPEVLSFKTGGQAKAKLFGNSTITASYQGINSNAITLSVTPPLVALRVLPSIQTIHLNTSLQFSAKGTYADYSKQDMTSSVNWISSNPSVATINDQGLVTAVSIGNTNITASFNDPALGPILSSNTTLSTLTVDNPLVSIAVNPGNSVINLSQTLQVFATGTFWDNSVEDITTEVQWTSSNPNVGSIISGGSVTSGRYAKSLEVGETIIQAKALGVQSPNLIMKVINPVTAITISSPSSSNQLNVGDTLQLTASGISYDQSIKNLTNIVTWSSSNPAIASINNSGLITANQNGQVTITATLPASADQALISAELPGITIQNPIVSIDVTPKAQYIFVNNNLAMKAVATYYDNSTQDITNQVQWSAIPVNVGSINNQTGLFTGLNAGASVINATEPSSGLSATTYVNVESNLLSISLSSEANSISAIGTTQLKAMAQYSGNPLPPAVDITPHVSWSIDNPSLCSIDSTGLLTGSKVGTPAITAHFQGINSPSLDINLIRYVYVANFGNNSISICPGNADGSINGPAKNNQCKTYTSKLLNGPISIAMHPNGQYLYVANYNISALSICQLSPVDGSITECHNSSGNSKGKPTITQPVGVSLTPDGKFVLLSNFISQGSIAVCSLSGDGQFISTCQTPYTNSSFYFPQTVNTNLDGTAVYISNSSPINTITACNLSQKAGQLAFSNCNAFGGYLDATSSFSASEGLSFDATGAYAYIANCGNNAKAHCDMPSSISVCTVKPNYKFNCPRSALNLDPSLNFYANWEVGIFMSNNNLSNNGYAIGYIPNNGNNTLSYCAVNLGAGQLGSCMVANDPSFNQPSGVTLCATC